jgi:hypothetical protein
MKGVGSAERPVVLVIITGRNSFSSSSFTVARPCVSAARMFDGRRLSTRSSGASTKSREPLSKSSFAEKGMSPREEKSRRASGRMRCRRNKAR